MKAQTTSLWPRRDLSFLCVPRNPKPKWAAQPKLENAFAQHRIPFGASISPKQPQKIHTVQLCQKCSVMSINSRVCVRDALASPTAVRRNCEHPIRRKLSLTCVHEGVGLDRVLSNADWMSRGVLPVCDHSHFRLSAYPCRYMPFALKNSPKSVRHICSLDRAINTRRPLNRQHLSHNRDLRSFEEIRFAGVFYLATSRQPAIKVWPKSGYTFFSSQSAHVVVYLVHISALMTCRDVTLWITRQSSSSAALSTPAGATYHPSTVLTWNHYSQSIYVFKWTGSTPSYIKA
jgi:hypothetical protein